METKDKLVNCYKYSVMRQEVISSTKNRLSKVISLLDLISLKMYLRGLSIGLAGLMKPGFIIASVTVLLSLMGQRPSIKDITRGN